MSFGNDPELMREKYLQPDIPYDEFKEIVEQSPMPEYDLVKDGGLHLPEFRRLQSARNYEEYKRIWKRIKEDREEDEWERRRHEEERDPRV